jgi:hypothetical protein
MPITEGTGVKALDLVTIKMYSTGRQGASRVVLGTYVNEKLKTVQMYKISEYIHERRTKAGGRDFGVSRRPKSAMYLTVGKKLYDHVPCCIKY